MSVRNKILILGGGGHACVVIDALVCSGEKAKIVGILDPHVPNGSNVLHDIEVLGGDDILTKFAPASHDIVIGVGPSFDDRRQNIWRRVSDMGFEFATVKHPTATVSSVASLAPGVQVMAGSVIQPKVSVEVNSVVNTGASIDHGSTIGAHSHIAPGATLCGDVVVEEGVYVGAGAVVMPGVKIGSEAVIGAGAVIKSDVPSKKVVYGFH